MRIVDWLLRIAAAVILLQTLFFKFTGAAESVYIFETLGAEPWGRWGSGMAELATSILLLMPRTAWAGGILGLGVMGGAILSHLFVLGIAVQDDGGLLFALGLTVFACCGATVVLHRHEIPVLRQRTT